MSALEIEFTFESSFCLSSRDDRSSVRLQNASSRRILSECCWNCSKMNSSLKLLLFLVMSRSICNSQQYFILWLQQLKWKNQALIYCHGSGNNAWVRKSLSFQDIKEIKGMRHRNCLKKKKGSWCWQKIFGVEKRIKAHLSPLEKKDPWL